MSTRRRNGRIAERPSPEQQEENDSPQPARRKTAAARKNASQARGRKRATVVEDEDEEMEEEQEEEEVDDDEEGGEDEEREEPATAPGGSDDDEGDEDEFSMPKVKIPYNKAAVKEVKAMGKEEMKRKRAALIRYILFCETRRIPLRREDAIKKVFGGAGRGVNRAYPYILNGAARALRKHWGFQLVEMRVRGGENKKITEQLAEAAEAETNKRQEDAEDAEEEEGGGASKRKKAAAPKSTNIYMIRSILPQAVISGMTQPDATLAAVVADVSEQEPSGRRPADAEGVMLDWKRADGQLGSMGLLHLILALIMVHQRSLSDNLLRSFLRRLRIDDKGPLPAALQPEGAEDHDGSTNTYRATQATQVPGPGMAHTLDSFLNQLVRQSYLERVRAATEPGAMTQTGRRARAPGGRRSNAANDDESTGVSTDEWRWGARAEVEIGEVAIAQFIAEIEAVDAVKEVRMDEEQAQIQREIDGLPAATGRKGRKGKGRASGGDRREDEEDVEVKIAKKKKQIQERVLEAATRAAGSALIV